MMIGPRFARYVLVLAVLSTAATLWPASVSAQQLVYVVRHAERADDGMAASGRQADPELSATGQARAARLAGMLADAGVSAVYATEFKRTQHTVKPLADRLGFAVQVSPARDVAGLVARLRTDHADDIVVLVGHSNTVPALIKALGGPDITLGEADYDNLFIVVPASGAVSRIKY